MTTSKVYTKDFKFKVTFKDLSLDLKAAIVTPWIVIAVILLVYAIS